MDASPPYTSTRERLITVAETIAPYAAEFLGTFFVVFTVGCNTISGNHTWMPTSISFAVMVVMYATATVSGGHLNPALSLAFGLSRKLGWHRVWGYLISQFAAGLLAGYITTALLSEPIMVGPKEGFNWLDSLIVELVYSSTFCFVALNCMASLRNNPKTDRNQFFALAVGFVGIAGGHTTGEISGAFFNPAVTLGFGFNSGTVGQRAWTLLYAGYQFAGAVAATLLFFLVRPEELAALGVTGDGLDLKRAFGALSFCSNRGKPSMDERWSEETWCSQLEGYRVPFPARVLAEFIGTYVVVFTFGLSTIIISTGAYETGATPSLNASSPVLAAHMMTETEMLARYHAGERFDRDMPTLMAPTSSTVSWATGAAVLCMAYSLMNVSGGHFNPAVTLAAICTGSCGSGRRRCRLVEGGFFMLAQAGAGIAAALSYVPVHRGNSLVNSRRVVDLGPKPGYGWPSVAVGETVFTMAVALSVLCMTTVRDPRYPKAPTPRSFHFAFAIGMCVTAGGFALEGITGGLLNPAVSLGVSCANIMGSGFEVGSRTGYFLYYLIWQMLGGVLAAVVFRMSHPLEYKEDPLLQ